VTAQQTNYIGLGHLHYAMPFGKKVFSYRNLNTGRLGLPDGAIVYSIRAQENIDPPEGFSAIRKGRVFHHGQMVGIEGARFNVQNSGNVKVRDTGIKHVHAGVCGTLLSGDTMVRPTLFLIMTSSLWSFVGYDPRHLDGFHTMHKGLARNGDFAAVDRVTQADFAILTNSERLGLMGRKRSVVLAYNAK
jgi:hypothetical protein